VPVLTARGTELFLIVSLNLFNPLGILLVLIPKATISVGMVAPKMA
jgi:hypothetical protein